jgi:hypothetical protein
MVIRRNNNMNNLDTLLESGKAAIAAKNELKQRVAENDEDWNKTSDLVKQIWTELELKPQQFKVGQQAVFVCDYNGISQDAQFVSARTPKNLTELQGCIKEYLDRVRLSYDEKMQP